MNRGSSTTKTAVAWVFDPSPPSGARTGGNVAQYAFHPDVNTLVREVNQNVLDNARRGSSDVSVAFNLMELKGEPLSSFLQAAQWSELERHIEAAGKETTGRRFLQARARLQSESSLQVLVIEDRNTTGLTGAECGEGSNFAQLCRDTLFSNKPTLTAGGSHGLGKAVLWLFSEFSTVLFNSDLESHEGTDESPRFIGRSELPWHRIVPETYAGSGWFGEIAENQSGEWARSVWAPCSEELAKPLRFSRDGGPGTSILVLGFRNPADEDQDLGATAQEMVEAVGRNFWPSVIGERLRATVTVTELSKRPQTRLQRAVAESDVNPAYAQCLSAYSNYKTGVSLAGPGDIAEIPIPVVIPARSDGSQTQIDAEASLVVRLADESETRDVNEVAFFRGTGMVVKYEKFDRLSLSQRPFHAMLVCGRARRDSTTSDLALEEFLRFAEPPEHKGWEVTARLKQMYKPGYKKLLVDIDAKVKEALRDLVSERPPEGTEGPRLLVRMFPFGRNQGRTERERFRVKDLSASLVHGAWDFSGSILVVGEASSPWRARIDMRYRGEDPTDSVSAVVKELSAHTTPAGRKAAVSIENGVALVEVARGVTRLRFQGSTNPSASSIDPRRATVTAEIHCEFEEGL